MAETGRKVLIIDDDKDLREILSAKLMANGFAVLTASGAPQGMEMARTERPDLVLLDVQMPEMSGVQAISKFKNDKELETIKVVFLTNLGEANPEDAWLDTKFAQEAGALGHIKKTDDLDHILEEVNKYLAQ